MNWNEIKYFTRFEDGKWNFFLVLIVMQIVILKGDLFLSGILFAGLLFSWILEKFCDVRLKLRWKMKWNL